MGGLKLNLSLLKNRNYSFFILGNAISLIGDDFLAIGLSLYVLSLTGSASQFATVLIAAMLPTIFLSPITGSIIDRIDRKFVLVFTNLLRGAIMIAGFIYLSFCSANLMELYIVSFIFGVCNSFYAPASMTVIPSILEEKDLVHGNLMSSIFNQICNVMAPIVAAYVYAFFGLKAVCLVDGVSFLVMGFIILSIKIKSGQVKNERKIFKSIADGFRLYKDKELLSISLNGMLTHMLIIPIFSIGFPYFVKTIFKGNDINFGTVQTICTIGTLFTFISVPFITKRFADLKALNITMYGMLGSISILFLLNISGVFNFMSISNLGMIIYLSIVGFLFYFSFSTYLVFYTSFIQKKVMTEYLGRFYALLEMLIAIGGVVGSKLYGFVFDIDYAFYPILIACIGMIIKLLLNLMITPDKKLGVSSKLSS